MKTLIAASLLLALASPAHAAKGHPKDVPLLMDWRDNFWVCRNTTKEKACAKADRLRNKMADKGYCTYARGAIGRLSKDRKHCYEMDNLLPAE